MLPSAIGLRSRRQNRRVAVADNQLALFADGVETPGLPLPAGWAYRADFIDAGEEAALLEAIAGLPLQEARFRGYTARRRVVGFGAGYDLDDDAAQLPARPMPAELEPLRARAASWLGVAPGELGSALVAEYRPGVRLGWHRDMPSFESVVGISLASTARMRFRRYPPVLPKKADVLALELVPRSAYWLQAEARWGWQHSIAPTPALRYSITFRTARTAPFMRPARPGSRRPE